MRNIIVQQFFKMSGNFIYLTAGISLVLISMVMIVYALSQAIQAIITQEQVIGKLLDGISLIIIAIAGFDVSKYLIEEEVLREKELRSSREAGQTLTKFMVIILIAISLESLVFIFAFSKEDVTTLIYPAMLLGLAALLLIGLGIYQRISVRGEYGNTPSSDQ